MQVRKQQLKLVMEQQTGSELRKEYDKAVYCHFAYFNLYAGYIMRNAWLDEAQDGIKLSAFGSGEAEVQLSLVVPNPGSSDTSRLRHAA